MRILIHSNAPWVPSGYGKQCALLIRTLRGLGHEVAVSAFYGLTGGPIEWEGALVLPAGIQMYGVDVLLRHADAVDAELIITLMDFWQLAPIAERLQEWNVAAWLPVDCAPLGMPDRETLKLSGATPIAMSRFGRDQLEAAGFRALYAPHVHDVDHSVYEKLQETREAKRAELGLDGHFVVGICSANNDHLRKAFPEQLEAFRRFRKAHPEALLMIHSLPRTERGLDLQAMAYAMDLAGAVRFSDPYVQVAGAFNDEMMLQWFSVLDVLSTCSYAEAFGVPLLEAQAVGTPAVSTHGSAMTENNRVGWRATGEPFWNVVHQAWWERPNIVGIRRAYEKAYRDARLRRGNAPRAWAETYHVDTAGPQFWGPVLAELEAKAGAAVSS